MFYMFKVYTLVGVIVFGSAGILMLALAGLEQFRQYALARQAMRRISSPATRESFANSRENREAPDAESYRAA